MAWIVFDKETRSAIGTPAKLAGGDPLAYALAQERSSVVVMPAAAADQVLLLTVKRAPKRKKPAEPNIRYVSSGFLGLTDEAAGEEAPEEKKSWWKKLFG
jgi:hypothetical protein